MRVAEWAAFFVARASKPVVAPDPGLGSPGHKKWGLASLVALVSLDPAAHAAVEVAPPPRAVAAIASEDPAAIIERLAANARSAGDRLARLDPGAATRDTQAGILKDLDALINRQENPPPDSGGPKDKNPPPKPMGGDGTPPKGGASGKPDDSPSASTPRPRPRRGGPGSLGGEKPMPGDAGPSASRPAGPKPTPDPAAKTGTGGGTVGVKPPAAMARPTLPTDDEIVKDVWGHLPEKLRQQVSSYYKQGFMERYADLLRQYYASLAERERPPDR